MKKLINALTLSWALTLGVQTTALGQETTQQINESKNAVASVVQKKEISNQDLNRVFDEKLAGMDISDEKKQEIKAIFNDESFKNQVFQILKKEAFWSLESVIISLILGFLYGYAYNSTIRKVKKQFMPIDPESFGIFGMTSGGMVLLNGFIPGSLVYLESFILASYAVYLHYKNIKSGKVYTPNFQEFFEENPLPIVRYSKDGIPLIWNKKMEEETGYSFDEVQQYYLKYGEVMSLLYSWDELERVKQYISQAEKTGIGYKNVAFTLITKSWEHKTFLWTTQPDGQWGTIRTARHLTNEVEIKNELNATLELLRVDTLTWALNRKAFHDDLNKIFEQKERKNELGHLVMVMMDIDNFKVINDTFWHDAGDEVLKQFTATVNSNIRSEDKIYRMGWDEFVIIFKTDNFDLILNKVNIIREKFYNHLFFFHEKSFSWVGTSWWLKDIDLIKLKDEFKSEQIKKIETFTSEVDYYMYAVKHLKFIKNELIHRGILEAQLVEKNAIWYPIYEQWSFIWVNVLNSWGKIFISKNELDLIISRKQELVLEKFQ